jgi:glutathione synthase/RimK-type ligase-like ATP-grasp enzyme
MALELKVVGLMNVQYAVKAEEVYVLEVNRCPGLKSFEKLTGFNVIKEFVKYLQK